MRSEDRLVVLDSCIRRNDEWMPAYSMPGRLQENRGNDRIMNEFLFIFLLV